ncbi:MAG: GxxExxY protein [Candidatus Methanoperedens sp.]|nr:GxxExxY protein [Candidatus Methanoperedens sp.]
MEVKFELEERGFIVKQQFPIQVTYKKNVVVDYYADLYIVDKIIIEVKAVNEITNIHKAQVLNYLKATGIKLGVLVNFSRERNTVDMERIPNLI